MKVQMKFGFMVQSNIGALLLLNTLKYLNTHTAAAARHMTGEDRTGCGTARSN